MGFDKSQYDQQYAKDHITRRFLAFNRDDADDAELLAWLASKGKGNMNAYIKGLIRDDMKKSTDGS